MTQHLNDLIHAAYAGFNARDADAALAAMHDDVEWPRAFKGGYVGGKDAVRAYWAEQWTEIAPHVDPTAVRERADGRVEVTVHQVVRDLAGATLADVHVKHVYTLADGRLRRMDIEEA